MRNALWDELAGRAGLTLSDEQHAGLARYLDLLALGHPVKQLTRLRREPVEAFAHVDTFDGPPFTI